MRIRHIILIVNLLYFGIIKGQSIISNSVENSSLLPNITPPSPDAFAITEYGKNAINEFNGSPSISIPIYNYKAGNLELPIYVNYNNSLVRVNDISSWTGINWVLTAGGVISRTVNKFPDESINYNREYINESELMNATFDDCSPNSQHYYDLSFYNETDTEVDNFRFNFNGYSGGFYLDSNMNPVLTNNDQELKIIRDGNLLTDKKFIIITPNGVKYFFGGDQVERTTNLSGSRAGSVISNTSFYLYRIEHPVNGVILLDYQTLNAKQIAVNKSYTQDFHDGNVFLQGGPITSILLRNEIQNPKCLSKIRSLDNSVEVNFNSTVPVGSDFVSVLNSIEIRNDSMLLRKIDFDYLIAHKNNVLSASFDLASRFFLSKVEFNKDLDTGLALKHEIYKMQYNASLDLPNRLSNSQDMIGLYNGFENNTLIPIIEGLNSGNSYSITNPYDYAERYPVFENASKGVLTHLYYPTGGNTFFEYEPYPAEREKNTTIISNIEMTSTGQNLSEGILPRLGLDENTMIFENPIYKDQEVILKLKTSSNNYSASYKVKKINLKITNRTTNQVKLFRSYSLGMAAQNFEAGFTFKKDSIYKIEVYYNAPNAMVSDTLKAQMEFTFMDGYEDIEGYSVRLKRQTDFTKDNITSNIVRYYYRGINELERKKQIYIKTKFDYVYDASPDGFGGIWRVFSEGSLCFDKLNLEVPNINEIVTTSFGGDNFENGGSEKYYYYKSNKAIERILPGFSGCWYGLEFNDATGEFDEGSFHCDAPPYYPSSITFTRERAKSYEFTDNSIFNGTLIHERFFKKINKDLFKIKESTYHYERSILNYATNFVGRALFGYEAVGIFCNGVQRSPVSSCYLGKYYVRSESQKLFEVISKDYIDPIPMNDYRLYPFNEFLLDLYSEGDIDTLEAPYKKITTTQNYEYGTLKGLPTIIATNTSDNSITKITRNHYANELNSLPGLTNEEQGALSNLVNENRIATPIQVEHYQNDELLATQKTIYKEHGNHLSLPERIQTSKGANALEDRVVFDEYDAKGNPTVVLLKDGTKTKYFYNALNQVVLKVENYTTALNIPDVPDLSNPCDFIHQYSSTMLSIYNYDPITHQIVSIVASNCQTTTYVYDELHQLKLIKDNDGNILQEFDHNYKH